MTSHNNKNNMPVTATESFCHKCGTFDNKDKRFLKCGACKVSKYCSKVCQKLDWKRHKIVCSTQKNERKTNLNTFGGRTGYKNRKRRVMNIVEDIIKDIQKNDDDMNRLQILLIEAKSKNQIVKIVKRKETGFFITTVGRGDLRELINAAFYLYNGTADECSKGYNDGDDDSDNRIMLLTSSLMEFTE